MFPCGEAAWLLGALCLCQHARPDASRENPVASVDFTDFHMSFRLRIMSMVAGALLLALIGLGYAALALQASQHSASRFFDHDLKTLHAIDEMYAQGLQTGQALRNVILDHSNPQGHQNLASALKAFDIALASAREASPERAELWQQIDQLQQQRRRALEHTLQLAADQHAEAVATLNASETPAWRALRKVLLDARQSQRQTAEQIKADTVADSRQAMHTVLVLGAVSLLVAAVLIQRVLASLKRELGGEPRAARQMMRRVADGDLTVHIDAPAGSLLATLDDMVTALRTLLEAIDKQAVELALDGDETSRASASMADTAQQEALAAGALTDSVNAFLDSAARIAESAQSTRHDADAALTLSREGAQLAQSAATRMDSLSRTVSQAADTIQVLDQRADKIASMTSVIKDIADQTNLLALNAAIEAARAGEQGRGFAVVADEVRKLAERTAQTTLEIDSLVNAIQHDTDAAVHAMHAALPEVDDGQKLASQAAGALDAIRDGAQRTVARVEDIAQASQGQTQASHAIAGQVQRVAAMVAETSDTIRQSAINAAHLNGIVVALKTQVERFRM